MNSAACEYVHGNEGFPLWWNVVDHPQVTHWRLCRAIWQQSGHHFDAIIFSILDFRSLLSFGHWRAHSPNRAIAVRQLDSLNRSFALYLPKRAAQGNEKTCKLPMLALSLANQKARTQFVKPCKSHIVLPKKSGSYRPVKLSSFFQGLIFPCVCSWGTLTIVTRSGPSGGSWKSDWTANAAQSHHPVSDALAKGTLELWQSIQKRVPTSKSFQPDPTT